ncbi:MAG TPA: hypothetical protein K8V56_07185 [Sporosarcina psychrophila]|uniref:Uncharacterized protein n=1 Tax=Sporosarcina psychrophila TaxID=1476 RepID=A0A921FXE3_SPOPS|nr:hypothetical protein [Sporosarcina psychrophila]
MKVRNVQKWYDKKVKVMRETKDGEFTMTKERFTEVNSTRFGILVEEVPENVKDKAQESPKK